MKAWPRFSRRLAVTCGVLIALIVFSFFWRIHLRFGTGSFSIQMMLERAVVRVVYHSTAASTVVAEPGPPARVIHAGPPPWRNGFHLEFGPPAFDDTPAEFYNLYYSDYFFVSHKQRGISWVLGYVSGVGTGSALRSDYTFEYPYVGVAGSLLIPLLMLAVVGGIVLRRGFVAQQRQRANLCVVCGYDLRAHGVGERCPECGKVITHTIQEQGR